jgi:protein gp37
MNRTKIEWCDYTWNPVTGCLHGCEYCYARRIAERFKGKAFPEGFKPTFHHNRLEEPKKQKKPSKIFTVSMGDLFGAWVPIDWRMKVLNTVENCPQHIFQFLTKNPSNYLNHVFPDNAWIGMTVTNLEHLQVINMDGLAAKTKFISIEPLLSGPKKPIEFRGIDWIIVGAQTGPKAVKPKPEWVQSIIDQARKHDIRVFVKDNVKWHEVIREYPEGQVS